MKLADLSKPQRKLSRMRTAFDAMKNSSSPAALEASWEDFIMAAGALFSSFEQASKGNGRSEAWFGRKKSDRKKNPSLRYIHHARNAEEHGIKQITDRSSSKVTLSSPGASVTLESDGISAWNLVKSTGDIIFANDIVILVRIFDGRFGDWFDPPNTNPVTVAEDSLAYFESTMVEAEALAS